jgi:hypothetical protein
LTTSPRTGSSSTTSPTPRVQVPRHVARLVTQLVVDYFASRRLVVDYFDYAACQVAPARRAARRAAHRRLLRLTQARRRLLRLHRASGCLGTSCGWSRGSSSTTPPRAGSSSTSSPTSRVRVPRLIARLVAWLVVDYFAHAARPGADRTSRDSSSTTSTTPRVKLLRHVARLVVDYFAYTARPGASARRAAGHAARRRLLHLAQACRRLLHLRRVYGCLGSSHGSSRGSSSTTSPTLRVRVPIAHRAARRRLLRLRRASGCFGMSRGSSSTSLPMPCVWVPLHVVRLVTRLVVDYFAYPARPGALARRAARHAARRRLLRLRHAPGCHGTSHGSSRDSSSTTSLRRACGSSCGSSSTTLAPCAAISSCDHTGSTSATPCNMTTCLAATLALLRVRRAPPRRHLLIASRRPFITVTPPITSRNQL